MNASPELQAVFDFLNSNEEIVILAMFCTVAIVWVVFGSIASVFRSVQRESTRREIAAYIAEGSMTPEQGERLLRAGEKKNSCLT